MRFFRQMRLLTLLGYLYYYHLLATTTLRAEVFTLALPAANNESSEVVDILLPVTFYFNPSTWLDNVKNVWRFVIILPAPMSSPEDEAAVNSYLTHLGFTRVGL